MSLCLLPCFMVVLKSCSHGWKWKLCMCVCLRTWKHVLWSPKIKVMSILVPWVLENRKWMFLCLLPCFVVELKLYFNGWKLKSCVCMSYRTWKHVIRSPKIKVMYVLMLDVVEIRKWCYLYLLPCFILELKSCFSGWKFKSCVCISYRTWNHVIWNSKMKVM